jgi:hypothetical protein
VGVADSGPGLRPGLAAAINAAGTDLAATYTNSNGTLDDVPHCAGGTVAGLLGETARPDPRSQTGMGIGIVQETLEARHGRLLAGRAREGGALLLMVLPLDASCSDEPLLPATRTLPRLDSGPAPGSPGSPGSPRSPVSPAGG